MFAPVLIPYAGQYSDTPVVRYEEVSSIKDIEFNRKSQFTAKEVVMPVTETLFYYNEDNYTIPSIDERKVLVFMRSCDIHGLDRIDRVYLNNGSDPDFYYKRLRDKVKIVVIGCEESFRNCFCVSFGTNTTEKYDLGIKVEKGDVFIDIKDEEFLDIFKGEETDFNIEFVSSNDVTVTLPEKLNPLEVAEAELWREYDYRCIACGRCNLSCPTCSCFTMQDIVSQDNGRCGERSKVLLAKLLLDEYSKQQDEIKKLEEYIKKNKVRTATAAQAKAREKKLNKIVKIELNKSKVKLHFNFKYSKAPWSIVMQSKDLVIGYDKPLTRPLNLKMERNDKIAIIGANGIGKTTLLKSLMGIIKPISGLVTLDEHLDIGYYEQEAKLSNKAVLQEVWNEFPNMNKTEIRQILARCGLTNEHINSNIDVLSGGEAAKVRLCKIINMASNILFLDEPTNHLDVDAKEELKRALIEYEGSIILVSNDAEFYKDIVNKVWNCEQWKA